MILLGLLLVLGVAGVAIAAFLANDGLYSAPIGAVDLFGYHAQPTAGQVFLAGTAAGAIILLGIFMIFSGAGRRARRRLSTRRELRDLQRKHDSVASELAAQQKAAEQKAAEEDAAVAKTS